MWFGIYTNFTDFVFCILGNRCVRGGNGELRVALIKPGLVAGRLFFIFIFLFLFIFFYCPLRAACNYQAFEKETVEKLGRKYITWKFKHKKKSILIGIK